MDTWSALVVGFGLGLRHASDADHVAVVSSLIQRSPSLLTAARIATLWGLGHTLTFLCLGLSLICLDLRVPPRFEQLTEILVALMLLVFGAWHLLSHAEAARAPSQGGGLGRWSAVRPILVGLVHGLAGSAGIALVASTTISEKQWAVAYLVLYGAGTIAGMVLLTVLIAPPLLWTQRAPMWQRGLSTLAALLNLGLGATFLLVALRRT
ncbi:MAG: high-affinity nickel-transport family protein [Myxococcales bacterium]|nr:high-affinity nickel-transport family protein [Myxococcales bacterium]